MKFLPRNRKAAHYIQKKVKNKKTSLRLVGKDVDLNDFALLKVLGRGAFGKVFNQNLT
jgi:hypothetical protein